MGVTSKTTLKGYFDTGDKPTQDNFRDLIDSFLHLEENNDTTLHVASISASANGLNINTASFGRIMGDLVVSGNILPVPNNDSFTSSFSLGSETAAWRDLFVSEDSIKFIKKKSDGTSELLAKIQIDKDR